MSHLSHLEEKSHAYLSLILGNYAQPWVTISIAVVVVVVVVVDVVVSQVIIASSAKVVSFDSSL